MAEACLGRSHACTYQCYHGKNRTLKGGEAPVPGRSQGGGGGGGACLACEEVQHLGLRGSLLARLARDDAAALESGPSVETTGAELRRRRGPSRGLNWLDRMARDGGRLTLALARSSSCPPAGRNLPRSAPPNKQWKAVASVGLQTQPRTAPEQGCPLLAVTGDSPRAPCQCTQVLDAPH